MKFTVVVLLITALVLAASIQDVESSGQDFDPTVQIMKILNSKFCKSRCDMCPEKRPLKEVAAGGCTMCKAFLSPACKTCIEGIGLGECYTCMTNCVKSVLAG